VSGTIHVLNGSNVDRASLDVTLDRLQRVFHCPVELHPFHPDLRQVYDPSRSQYHSSGVLKQMLDDLSAHGDPKDKLLGIVDVDLFIPVLTFVYGEAQLSGRCAVVSTFRLRNELYGMPANDRIFRERIEKESVHEIGHVFGLVHCRGFECVMRSSTYVEEIDLKPAVLCQACAERLAAPKTIHNPYGPM
jgi:archaemetzincin